MFQTECVGVGACLFNSGRTMCGGNERWFLPCCLGCVVLVVGLCFLVLDVSVCESFIDGEDGGWDLLGFFSPIVELRAKFWHIRVSRWAPESQEEPYKVIVGSTHFFIKGCCWSLGVLTIMYLMCWGCKACKGIALVELCP